MAHSYSASMRVLVSGASGLVGTALREALAARGDEVATLSRSPRGANAFAWDPAAGTIDARALDGVDAVVHLAGESIAAGRWSAARKAAIRDSRVQGTGLLARLIAESSPRPLVMVSASAVGFYGDRGDEVVDESSPSGDGFLPEVCRAWEAATAPAEGAGVRVAHLRSGMILSSQGGALAKMLTPFRLGLGGPIGSGTQWMSWIHLDDEVALILALLDGRSGDGDRSERPSTPEPRRRALGALSGPINAVAPEPVRNREFVTQLGLAVHRPAVLPMPAFAVRVLFGEMGQRLLLEGQHVVPRRAVESGFTFRHPGLAGALAAELHADARGSAD